MKTIEQLRDELATTVTKLQSKEISAEEAMAVSRAAGAVIGSLRVEISYRKARAEKPEIRYFDSANAVDQARDADARPDK